MEALSAAFGAFCKEKGLKVVTAESCTAGLIGSTISMTVGASAWLDRGFLVYTPKSKIETLGVQPHTIEHWDVTSIHVAHEMAMGALKRSDANFALAVTGLAGPGGGTDAIPVGTVCMAWAYKPNKHQHHVVVEERVFEGDRNEIREAVVAYMLQHAIDQFSKI